MNLFPCYKMKGIAVGVKHCHAGAQSKASVSTSRFCNSIRHNMLLLKEKNVGPYDSVEGHSTVADSRRK